MSDEKGGKDEHKGSLVLAAAAPSSLLGPFSLVCACTPVTRDRSRSRHCSLTLTVTPTKCRECAHQLAYRGRRRG